MEYDTQSNPNNSERSCILLLSNDKCWVSWQERSFFLELCMTWKTIKDYPDYQASDTGKVRSCKFGKKITLKPCTGGPRGHGYPFVSLYQNGENVCCVHRLVLVAFVGPCPEGLEVNHKNGIKTDNRLANLEYVTRSENNLHAFRTGLKTPSNQKKVRQFSRNGKYMAQYKSGHAAGRHTSTQYRDILACANGIRKTAGGFIWRFADAS